MAGSYIGDYVGKYYKRDYITKGNTRNNGASAEAIAMPQLSKGSAVKVRHGGRHELGACVGEKILEG